MAHMFWVPCNGDPKIHQTSENLPHRSMKLYVRLPSTFVYKSGKEILASKGPNSNPQRSLLSGLPKGTDILEPPRYKTL